MIDNNVLANKAIERLKTIDAEITIIKSKVNEQIESLNKESEELKSQLKEFYYSLPKEQKEETKTLVLYKLNGGKLQEKLQEPEYVREESILLDWLNKKELQEFIKVIPETKAPDWASLKKDSEFKVVDGKATYKNELVEGVVLKEREPKFEVVIK